MGQLLILLAVALVAAALAWGVAVLLLGRDQGLDPAEPDGRAIPLPTARPLTEADFGTLRFDTTVRGYRMAQVDQAVRRAAYDVGYKEELIGVLEAEVAALRHGRLDEAEALRQAREAAQRPRTAGETAEPDDRPAVGSGSPAEAAVPPPAPPADAVPPPVDAEPLAADAEEPLAAAAEEPLAAAAEEPLAAPAAPADREPDDAVDDDAGTARAVDGGDAEDDVDAEAPGSAATVDGWVASGARTGKPAGDGAADAEK